MMGILTTRECLSPNGGQAEDLGILLRLKPRKLYTKSLSKELPKRSATTTNPNNDSLSTQVPRALFCLLGAPEVGYSDPQPHHQLHESHSAEAETQKLEDTCTVSWD